MWFLCMFYHRLLDYRKPEVESLAELFGAFDLRDDKGRSLEWRLPENHHPDSPFHFVDLPSEEVARDIANRSILVKGIYELWGEGATFEELKESISGYPDERKSPFLVPDSTFRITVDTFGKVISFEEQTERIHSLAFIPFKVRSLLVLTFFLKHLISRCYIYDEIFFIRIIRM